MPTDPRARRALRLASGTALCLAASFGLGLPLPFIAPLLATFLLAPGSPGQLRLAAHGEPSGFVYRDQESLVRLCAALVRMGLPLKLGRVVAGSPTDVTLAAAFRSRGVLRRRSTSPYPVVDLDEGWREPEQHFNAGRRSDVHAVSVGFCDLVGFTRLGEGVPAADLGLIATRLAALAAHIAEPPVRLIKTIGDAVMLVAPEPAPLLEAILDVMEAADGEGADFPAVSGQMRHGDALLLYTDGMVETRTRDIALGIDRMLGQAERLLRGQFEGGATRLIEALGSRNDDRALLLVHRR